MSQYIVKCLKTYLKSPLTTSATSVVLRELTDSKGNNVSLADFGAWGVVVIKQGETIEMIKFDGLTQNATNCTLTVATNGRNLNPTTPYAGSSTGNAFQSGAEVIVTNDPLTVSQFGNLNNANTWALLQTFTVAPVSSVDASGATELVRKSQLDAAVLGSLSLTPVVEPATGGEVLAIDQLVYQDPADGEWKLCDADTAASVENVRLGITRGAGTDGGAITDGVTTGGMHTASSAIFTANTKYYASNTAGGFSTSAGTKEVTVGFAHTTTQFSLAPRYDQQLTENQQDLITAIEGGTDFYAASAVGSDSYAITIAPPITAYVTGMKFRFKADVANTGACTLAVSGLSALAIKKNNDQDLATGDIEVGQIVEVVYDGTDFQMQSQLAQTSITGVAEFGDGSDGAMTADGVTTYNNFSSLGGSIYTLTRDAYLTDLTGSNGVSINAAGYRLYINGTLTQNGTFVIYNNGGVGGNGVAGTNALGDTNGGLGSAGGSAGTAAAGVTVPAGIAGVAGGTGGDGADHNNNNAAAGGTGTAGVASANSLGSSGVTYSSGLGGVGGNGVAGNAGAGGSAGAGGTATASKARPNNPLFAQILASWLSGTLTQFKTNATNGGGGGGSGGGSNTTGTNGGGGGGGGGGGSGANGGFVFVSANNIVVNAGVTLFQAKGGAGGNGGAGGKAFSGGNAAGGGGGGGLGIGGNGGIVVLLYKTKSGTITYDVTGGANGSNGAGGSGAGTSGTTGNAGTATATPISGQTFEIQIT